MTVKKDKKEVSMELEYYEQNELTSIQSSREALRELQSAVIPFAEAIATRQRVWWNRVLEVRGLTRDGTQYTVKDGRRIVDELAPSGVEE